MAFIKSMKNALGSVLMAFKTNRSDQYPPREAKEPLAQGGAGEELPQNAPGLPGQAHEKDNRMVGSKVPQSKIVPVTINISEILGDEIKEWNEKEAKRTAAMSLPGYVDEEKQVGQWVLAGGKPDGKNCKHCLALHTKKMTYGKFLDKKYTTSCGGNCRCDFMSGTTVEPQTAEQLKAIRGQVGQWVLAGMEPDGGNCEDCLALHGKKMTYGRFLNMKHEMAEGGDECRCDFKLGTTVKRLTKKEIKAALEE